MPASNAPKFFLSSTAEQIAPHYIQRWQVGQLAAPRTIIEAGAHDKRQTTNRWLK
jgi:hypothetical protein